MQSMRMWHERAGIGPWYHFSSTMEVTFANERSAIDVLIAFANSGGLQIELIEQRNEAPSAFRAASSEPFELHRLHHYAFWPVDYEESIRTAERAGLSVIQTIHVSRGRVTYWKGPEPDGAIIELAESTEARQRTRDMVASAAQYWDGDRPFRTMA
jgi:Glyoxalase/Bleomycin resistance protein/Dioxygenase superfamily